MIGASRRRTRSELSFEEAFLLHRRIARRTTWDRRLLRGAVAALAASVLGLLFPLTIPQRALILTTAFVASAALPVRRQRERALRSIREQSGLGYETALEILADGDDMQQDAKAPQQEPGAPTGADPYGLRAAVVHRARNGIRDVRVPDLPAWWLPPIAIALGLLLLPAVGPVTGTGGGGSVVNGATTGGDQGAAGGDGGEELGPPQDAPGRADEPDGMDAANEDDDTEGPGAAPPSGEVPSQAPLSRFLDSLRERPQDQAGEGGSGQQPQGGQPQGGQPPPEGAPGEQSAPRGAPQNAGEPGAGEEGAEGGEAAEASTDTSAEDGGAEGDAAAQAGADDGGAGGDEAGQQPGGDEGQGAPSGEDGGGQGEGERGEGLTDSAGGDEGGEGIGDAGGAPGAASEAGVLDSGPEGAPDLLQGVLGEGPESPAGTVRLPGEDEVELPAGTAYAPYRTAAEDALTEGDIPLSYQEIIRRYFR